MPSPNKLRRNIVTGLFVMPPKTKGKLKDELEHIRRELAEAKVKLEEEVAEAVAAAEERARESDKKLKKELQTAR